MTITLYEGDSYIVLRRMIAAGIQVASVVCDPPYGLTSIIERFGKEDAKAARFGTDGAFARASKGFMGRQWDGSGIERDPEFWKLIFQVLLPGGYVVAFSSARTYDLMASALREAGFVTHPMIGWVYASGMPKPHNPKIPGLEGWRHGGQVRKPAIEPIYVGQKPFSERTAALNIQKHGVGAVNVDGIMIPAGEGKDPRYPSNLITDGSAEVDTLFPDADGQRGASTTAVRTNNVYYKMTPNAEPMQPRKDGGSAMRFFEAYPYACDHCLDQGWVAEDRGYGDYSQEQCPVCEGLAGYNPFEGEPIIYHRKANAEDRAGSEHATVKPIGLMRSLVRHVTPPGTVVLDPFAGTGTTGIAADLEGLDAILIEAEPEYAQDIRRRTSKLTDAGDSYLKAVGIRK